MHFSYNSVRQLDAFYSCWYLWTHTFGRSRRTQFTELIGRRTHGRMDANYQYPIWSTRVGLGHRPQPVRTLPQRFASVRMYKNVWLALRVRAHWCGFVRVRCGWYPRSSADVWHQSAPSRIDPNPSAPISAKSFLQISKTRPITSTTTLKFEKCVCPSMFQTNLKRTIGPEINPNPSPNCWPNSYRS